MRIKAFALPITKDKQCISIPTRSKQSIQKTKLPQWDAVVVSHFCLINGEVTIRFILDLVESLILSANFKQILAIDHKVAFQGKHNLFGCGKLVVEKDFAHGTVHQRAKSRH